MSARNVMVAAIVVELLAGVLSAAADTESRAEVRAYTSDAGAGLWFVCKDEASYMIWFEDATGTAAMASGYDWADVAEQYELRGGSVRLSIDGTCNDLHHVFILPDYREFVMGFLAWIRERSAETDSS